jgi:hypothetical protein
MIRTLSCHCGAIRLECNAPLERLGECNCSTCGRHGFLHWKVPKLGAADDDPAEPFHLCLARRA